MIGEELGTVAGDKMWNYIASPLLLLLTIQAAGGAPTLGDDVVANFKENMAFVHGNIMAAITNILKPLLDLVEMIPNAIMGRKVPDEPERNFISNIILGGAGTLNSGIKLASTLIAAPFKLAGDGMMALESVILGKSLDSPEEVEGQKRDLSQSTIESLIDEGLGVFKQLDENQNSRRISSKQRRQIKPKFLEGLRETLDDLNDFIAEKANEDGDILLFLGQLFARD